MATHWQKQAQLEVQHLLGTQQRLGRFLSQPLVRPTLDTQDFSSDLPLFSRNQVAVDNLQRSAREAGVVVISISLREALITRKDQFGRLELTVAAQGNYASLKQLLAEWLDRFPSATVRSQQWRRVDAGGTSGAGPATVETNWVLSVWTRPPGIEAGAPSSSNASSLAASSTTAR